MTMLHEASQQPESTPAPDVTGFLAALQGADGLSDVERALLRIVDEIGGASWISLEEDEVAGFGGEMVTIEAGGRTLGSIRLQNDATALQRVNLRQAAQLVAPYALIFRNRDELDVSRRQLVEVDERLRATIDTDELTGVGSRLAFENAYRTVARERMPHVVAVFRVVGLEHVGARGADGWQDAVLIDVARHLQRALGDAVIARIGAEFAALFPERSLRQVQMSCVTLLTRLKMESTLRPETAAARVAVGLADGRDGQTWQNAIDATTVAAAGASEAIRVFDPRGPETSLVRADREWVQRLPQTLGGDELTLFGQAIMELTPEGDRLHAYEVLLRGARRHSDFDVSGFVETAMRVGREVEVDLWVLDEAIRWLAADPSVPLSVNMCPRTVGNPPAIDGVVSRLDAAGIAGDRLIVEITDHESIRDPRDLRRSIERLRSNGVRVALDDLGPGWSSLEYLRDLELDYVKIDGRWISRVLDDRMAEIAVDSMLESSQVAGAKVVAEWVESEAVRQRLIEKGFELGQGFHLHAPQPFATLG